MVTPTSIYQAKLESRWTAWDNILHNDRNSIINGALSDIGEDMSARLRWKRSME